MLCRSGSLVVVGLAVLLWPCALRAQEGLPNNNANNAASNAGNVAGLGSPYLPAEMNSAPGPGANATPPQSQSPIGSEAPTTLPADGRRPFTPFMLGDFVGFVTNQFSDMKIAEGESPQPLDRVFYRFNWYNNVAPARWTSPTETIHNVNLYRNVFGFEKTFLTVITRSACASRSTLSKPMPSPMWSASKGSIRRSSATSLASSRRCCGRTAAPAT